MKIKIIKRAFDKWSSWQIGLLAGINPPWTIDGQVVFDPTFKEICEEEVRDEKRTIAQMKELRDIIDNPSTSQSDKNSATVALSLYSDEGRKALAKAMCVPIERKMFY